MSKRSLSDWAAIAEIVGTAAILVSLVFVVMSIRQNTSQLRLQNENFLYELQDSARADFVSSPWLVDISIKVDSGEELTPAEIRRYFAHFVRSINLWEMIFYWHQDGFLEEQSWLDWDDYYSGGIGGWLSKEMWTDLRSTYSPEFVEHVDRKFE